MKKQPKKFITTQKRGKGSTSVSAKIIQSKESPSISRLITEEKGEARLKAARSIPEKQSWFRSIPIMTSWGVVLVSFLTGGLLMANVLLGTSVLDHAKELSAKEAIRTQLLSERLYWEGVVSKHPDYKDAQFQLALRLYQLGEQEQARIVFEQVLAMDPQNSEVRELLEKLRG